MATQRDIRKRIKSVSSTKKITKTMEMISTSKMKKMHHRFSMSKPYEKKLEQIICTLADSGYPVSENSMFRTQKVISDKMLIMITGNRGLCSGYNTSILDNTLAFRDKIEAEGNPLKLYVVGKKGINYCKFINIPMYKQLVNPDDKITFEDARKIGSEFIDLYSNGEIGEIHVSYTKMISAASYKPDIYRLLPISIEDIMKNILPADRPGLRKKFILEPDPKRMLSSLLPMYISSRLYVNFLESGFAEQSARRVAMKNATDAASDMVKDLTVKYNRVRQAKITSEIAEIVGGVSAIE